jgi:hypothetical protein
VLELSVDEYQRYDAAARLVAALGIDESRPIVDVPGAAGMADAFLTAREIVVTGLESDVHIDHPDRAFGVALALDTLEYVDPRSRAEFLAELRRIADVVIVCAPFANPAVDLAENALIEFVRLRLGREHLVERRRRVLPSLEESVASFEQAGWMTTTLPCGYLPRWVACMLVRHDRLASGKSDLPLLNAFYNATLSPLDLREPSYRHVLLAARELPLEQLVAATDSVRSPSDGAHDDVAAQILSAALHTQHLDDAADEQERRRREQERRRREEAEQRAEVIGLGQQIASRDAQIEHLRALAGHLQAELHEAHQATLREARRSISSTLLQRAADWRARRGR